MREGRPSYEGPGELRLVRELELRGVAVRRNSSGTAFPDLVDADGRPFAEVKSVRSPSDRIRLGGHRRFIDGVRRGVYGGMLARRGELSWEETCKVCAGYLGRGFLVGNLGEDDWLATQRTFLHAYIRSAGNLIVTSPDCWTFVTPADVDRGDFYVDCIDRLEVGCKMTNVLF